MSGGLTCVLSQTRISSFNLAIEMLVMSGEEVVDLPEAQEGFQSRNRDACHFRSRPASPEKRRGRTVSISQSRCLSFQACRSAIWRARFGRVSISQSRCLSFQACVSIASLSETTQVSISQSRCLSFQGSSSISGTLSYFCFNLAIEMLVMSGKPGLFTNSTAAVFQSRNRDACHVRCNRCWDHCVLIRFQSRNRDACHFRETQGLCSVLSGWVSISQSRCLSFQANTKNASSPCASAFQSRNRDACHFRFRGHPPSRHTQLRFNLVIEMLVISGPRSTRERRR